MTSGLITSWQIDGEKMETVTDFILGGSKITADGNCSHEIKRCLLLGRKAVTNLDSISKSRDITDKGLSRQSYSFSSIHVWVWELDYKESWVPKNWCFWTVVLEKTLESPLDCKESQPVHPKGKQSWIFIGRTDAETETPIFDHWCQELPHWKRHWCSFPLKIEDWERLKAGEGDDRGWACWMVSWTQWTWVWASSGSWCWIGKSGVLQSMGLQRVRHDWVTELIIIIDITDVWTELSVTVKKLKQSKCPIKGRLE